MRTGFRLPVSAAVIVAVALVGCGAGSKLATSTPTRTPTVPSTGPIVKVASRTYVRKLAGKNAVPAGAMDGSAAAVISIHGNTDQLCWKFSALKNVISPLVAHVHKGLAGAPGPVLIPLDGGFSPSGCTYAPGPVLATIESSPLAYYVDIHNAKYPQGAVRAQL
jgi:hypothetical protein